MCRTAAAFVSEPCSRTATRHSSALMESIRQPSSARQPVSFRTYIVGKRTSSLGRCFDSCRPYAVLPRRCFQVRSGPGASKLVASAKSAVREILAERYEPMRVGKIGDFCRSASSWSLRAIGGTRSEPSARGQFARCFRVSPDSRTTADPLHPAMQSPADTLRSERLEGGVRTCEL